jgi:hypothetical protein
MLIMECAFCGKPITEKLSAYPIKEGECCTECNRKEVAPFFEPPKRRKKHPVTPLYSILVKRSIKRVSKNLLRTKMKLGKLERH